MTIIETIDPETRWIIDSHLDSFQNGEISRGELLHFIDSEYKRLYKDMGRMFYSVEMKQNMVLSEYPQKQQPVRELTLKE